MKMELDQKPLLAIVAGLRLNASAGSWSVRVHEGYTQM
jgi:hypothetical protein